MKIIRLTTQNSKCVWDNYFNDELTIKKNSKVALHNISVELDLDEYTLNAQNNELRFDLNVLGQDNTERQVELQEGTYNKQNIGELFEDLTTKCNQALGTNSAEIGKEWNIGLGKDTKINFQCNLGDYIFPEDPLMAKYVNFVNCAIINNRLQRTAGTPGSGDSNLFFKTALALGSSIFRIRISSQAYNPTSLGVFMGVSTTYLPARVMTSEQAKYAIRYLDSLTPYRYNIDGDQFNSTILPEVNDNAYLLINGGRIRGIVERANGTQELLFSEPYDHQTYLFPFVSMYGAQADTQIQINAVRMTSSYSYNKEITLLSPPNKDETEVEFPAPSNNPRGTTQRIIFPIISLARFLGFSILTNNSYVEQVGTKLNISGDKQVNFLDNAPSYIVELQNVPLEFYDGASNQTKNYLYAFPNQEGDISERLNYSTSYPVFLDVKSLTDLTFKNIKCRLIREDGSVVDVKGLSVLTILIQED
jgi:hypothetical protein